MFQVSSLSPEQQLRTISFIPSLQKFKSVTLQKKKDCEDIKGWGSSNINNNNRPFTCSHRYTSSNIGQRKKRRITSGIPHINLNQQQQSYILKRVALLNKTNNDHNFIYRNRYQSQKIPIHFQSQISTNRNKSAFYLKKQKKILTIKKSINNQFQTSLSIIKYPINQIKSDNQTIKNKINRFLKFQLQ